MPGGGGGGGNGPYGGGGHGMGGGQFGGVMRSMRRDDSVTQQRVTKGTAKRMFQFARPYRKILTWFLVLVTIEAALGIVNPLLFRSIINNVVGHHNKTLIIGLALVAAGVAVADTAEPLVDCCNGICRSLKGRFRFFICLEPV